MELIGICALIALFSLEQKYAFQFALSQPLIFCSGIGLLLGDFQTAIYFGMFVQLVWLGNLPVGASTPPEGNLASAVGCVIFVQFNESYVQFEQVLLLLVFLYVILISYLGVLLDVRVRRFNIRLFDFAINNIRDDKKANIGKVVFFALTIQYFVSFLFVFFTVLCGKFLLRDLNNYLSLGLLPIVQYVELAIIGIGIGMVISVFKGRRVKKIILAISLFGLIIFKII